MSSTEDMFDLSDDIEFQQSPSPPPVTPTPPTPTPPTPSPVSATPPGQGAEALPQPSLFESQAIHHEYPPDVDTRKTFHINDCSKIRLDFLDEEGNKVSPSRYTSNLELIKIMKSLILSENSKYRHSTAVNIVYSDLLKEDIQKQVLHKLSSEFSEFISSDSCPLKDATLYTNIENVEDINLDRIFDKCVELGGNLMTSFATICFNSETVPQILENCSKYQKQRLLAIIAISAITRNRNVNVLQKILGEFFKLKSANRQVLQILHRLGLSLVSMAVRSDMDVISSHFMTDVKSRKVEIMKWAVDRDMLDKLVKYEIISDTDNKNNKLKRKPSVKYTPCEFVDKIVDLGELESLAENISVAPNEDVQSMVNKYGSAKEALEVHLDNCPAAFTVTYDNIDMGRTTNEFLGDAFVDQSLHWCSSMVFEDVVCANELKDSEPKRPASVEFDKLVKLNKEELNHLLTNYTQLVINLIVKNWPKCFPDMKSKQIRHQYSKQFEAGVKAFTGPLVCETESTLEVLKLNEVQDFWNTLILGH